jgi:hypothetical protein
MGHTAVVRQKMTERYLLDELEGEVREQFEEHYFDCPECALDVSAGAQFVAQTKAILAERPQLVSAPAGVRRMGDSRRWFAWLRPAFAAPALALLLAVIGYQNLVTYPRIQAELNRPQVLPAVAVNVGTWGPGGTPNAVPEGKGLLLFLRIPPDSAYVRYTADVYAPGGAQEGSFTITPAPGQDQWPVAIPALHREAGKYTLTVHGITAGGESKDLGNTAFELQIQR